MQLDVRSPQVKNWLDSRDPFAAVKAIRGNVVRSKEGRTTQRFEIKGDGYYVKLHEGVGWLEILKNLLQLRLPIIGASNEWRAINRLHELNVDTMQAVAFADMGGNLATRQSFVMTEELTGTLSLAQYCEQWQVKPPAVELKWRLIDEVARIARVLHEDGINHRDMYICHFLLDISAGLEQLNASNVRLFLVDLHRAQMRSTVPEHWLVKDVASIYFSAMDVGLSKRDVYRFIRAYTGLPLREALLVRAEFWGKVTRRARRLYIRDWKREPRDIFSEQE